MITANAIHRVFRIESDSQIGSSFAVDVDGKQYLVTARHLVSALSGTAQVGIFANGAWNAVSAMLVGHAPGDVDISVLAVDRRLTPGDLPLEMTSHGLIYGQDVFFLGFPYNILSKFILGADGYPLPLVKKAIVSSFDKGFFLLDGHNNPGFSGGPVVFTSPNRQDFKVAAVISGFTAVEEPVFAAGQKTTLTYQSNTGIIVAYPADHAMELIRSNPIGLPL